MKTNEKFMGKYRIPSARKPNWDYRNAGSYFITICTKDRIHYFGEIEHGKMIFSPIGVLADVFWHEIKNHSKNILLGEFVVMPNHIHGILIVMEETLHATSVPKPDDAGYANVELHAETLHATSVPRPEDAGYANELHAETLHATSVPRPEHATSAPKPEIESWQKLSDRKRMSDISPKPNSISTIIRSYKSAVTKHAKRLGYEFEWQTRFHDIVIRDEQAFLNISNYIRNNVINWREDKFHKTENS